jgi:hypothetical protein
MIPLNSISFRELPPYYKPVYEVSVLTDKYYIFHLEKDTVKTGRISSTAQAKIVCLIIFLKRSEGILITSSVCISAISGYSSVSKPLMAKLEFIIVNIDIIIHTLDFNYRIRKLSVNLRKKSGRQTTCPSSCISTGPGSGFPFPDQSLQNQRLSLPVLSQIPCNIGKVFLKILLSEPCLLR